MKQKKSKPNKPKSLLENLSGYLQKKEALDRASQGELNLYSSILGESQFIQPPTLEFHSEPLSIALYEYYILSLRLLEAKIKNSRVSFDKVYLTELDLFEVDEELRENLSLIQDVKGVKGHLIKKKVMQEILAQVNSAISVTQKLKQNAIQTHGNFFPWSDSLEPLSQLEQDILVLVFSCTGVLDSFFNNIAFPSRFSRKIGDLVSRLNPIYTRTQILNCLSPKSKILTQRFLEVDVGDIGNQWEEVKLHFPVHMNKLITQVDHLYSPLRPFDFLTPNASIEDVIIPEVTKEQILSLCHLYTKQRKMGLDSRLTFLFKGEPGTGKTLLANAIAKYLGLDILRINFSKVSNGTPMLISYFVELAKSSNLVLLFEECENLFWHNQSQGSSDGWAKVMFESFQGVSIFNTNHDVPPALERRMTYVRSFKKPCAKVREHILKTEVQKLYQQNQIKSVPQDGILAEIAKKYSVPGGYFPQALQLATARSEEGELDSRSLHEAFSHCQEQMGMRFSSTQKEPKISLGSVQLNSEQAKQVKNFIQFSKKVLEKSNLKASSINPINPINPMMPSGATAIFSGPPGTGKTITAEAIAHELKIGFHRISPSSVLSMYVGETEKKIKEIFREAQEENYLLFIDEAEGLLLDRQGAQQSWEKTQVDELLQQIESFKGILIVATNFSQMMDIAFGRRFLFHMHFDLPDFSSRSKLWELWQNELELSPGQIQLLAHEFALSGGEIRNIAIRALATQELDLKSIILQCESLVKERTGVQKRKLGF